LSTVGLSRGITPELTDAGKIIIVTIMFLGRFGIISFALVAVAMYRDEITTKNQSSESTKSEAHQSNITQSAAANSKSENSESPAAAESESAAETSESSESSELNEFIL
jgi:cytoskeletal protein RodZ